MSNETSTKNDLVKGEGLATFTSQVPRWKMSDLILPPALCEQMENAISVSKYSDLIYTTWGFSEIEPQPRAVLNFYGAPGTGKTMAAHCIANELGKKIIVANFAEIESKYVGDSPKNLENIFSVAKAEDAVLFFDEADSFLGRRITAISSSSDQAVNSLRSKLLQLLEEHTGIVIFSTNLLKNYDKAFDSRILFNLQFELPDLECRKKLIRQKIPRKLPFECDKGLDDSVIKQLAEITEGFSGREIKNAVLQVLCRVASESRRVFLSSDFVEGFTRKKEEIEKIKKERNEFDPQRKAQIGKCIEENLTKGNFSVKASSNQ